MNRWMIRIGEIAEKLLAEFRVNAERGPRQGLRLGWPLLDEALGGLQPGTITLLASRGVPAGLGLNSQFALNCALQVAVEQNLKTVYVTTRATPVQITRRLIDSIAQERIQGKDKVTPEMETAAVCEAAELLKDRPLLLLDACGLPFKEYFDDLAASKDLCPNADESDQPKLYIVDSLDDLFLSEEAVKPEIRGLSAKASKTVLLLEELLDIAAWLEEPMLVVADLPYTGGRFPHRDLALTDHPHFRVMSRYVSAFIRIGDDFGCPAHERRDDAYWAEVSRPRETASVTGFSLRYDAKTKRFR